VTYSGSIIPFLLNGIYKKLPIISYRSYTEEAQKMDYLAHALHATNYMTQKKSLIGLELETH
jgi:hypothetical protein